MEKMYNQKQAAQYTGKGIMTIRRAIEHKKLIGIEISKRVIVFTESELDAWAKTIRPKAPSRKDGK